MQLPENPGFNRVFALFRAKITAFTSIFTVFAFLRLPLKTYEIKRCNSPFWSFLPELDWCKTFLKTFFRRDNPAESLLRL
jgi:hypothetical protein